ncbi:helix-turn-helix domain-containing protein [Elizabethkingia anophelis]|uniref:helix-turn-helix domain-containing protein n=1 Tax=Elizabethkingia anophelis TaxID=1117645 RepID=UPI0023EA2735|nr:helix-turn-helix transcriptional regulator [Elizabethkingia anophelis]GJN60189.1 transcriptional regulator [Elizabethkingia anophelis]HDP3254276.1 helix-turn-helix transcriptional regulator [Elizabethkingia anophelis]
MIHTDMPNKKIHQGRNIKRFREMLGIKQDALAYELGEDWNQKKISLLEQKESVEKDILEQVAKILKVPTEAIENFDEDSAINIIANTFHDSAVANTFTEGAQANFHCTFNPLDKVMELFERLLASEREKVELMKEILEKMK